MKKVILKLTLILSFCLTVFIFSKNTIAEVKFKKPDIFTAASQNDLESVHKALKSGINVNAKDEINYTALHWAAYKGHVKVVEALIENGADVNLRDKLTRETALHKASYNGHEKVVEVLIRNGAKVNYKDADGLAAVHWAALGGQLKVIDTLRQNKADMKLKDNEKVTYKYIFKIMHPEKYEKHKNKFK